MGGMRDEQWRLDAEDTSTLEDTAGAHSRGPDTRLGCVAVPILASDIDHRFRDLLALWSDPRFFPVTRRHARKPHLLVVVNNAPPEALAKAEAVFRAFPSLAECFAACHAHSAGLEGDRDLYVRGATRMHGRFGNKAGPNLLFQQTMQFARQFGGFTLQTELDCLPVQAGWLESAQAVIAANARAWIIGSTFAGRQRLTHEIQMHLNGNAIYKAGDDGFQAFLNNVWMPGIFSRADTDPNLAYDCWWALMKHKANQNDGEEAWQLFQRYDAFFHNDPFIVNLLSAPAECQEYRNVFERLVETGRTPVFLHGPAMTSLLSVLLNHPKDSVFDAIDRIAPPAQPHGRTHALVGAPGTWAFAPRGHTDSGRTTPSPLADLAVLADEVVAGATEWSSALLAALATELLLHPVETLAWLAEDEPLRQAIARARTDGNLEAPLRAHFNDLLLSLPGQWGQALLTGEHGEETQLRAPAGQDDIRLLRNQLSLLQHTLARLLAGSVLPPSDVLPAAEKALARAMAVVRAETDARAGLLVHPQTPPATSPERQRIEQEWRATQDLLQRAAQKGGSLVKAIASQAQEIETGHAIREELDRVYASRSWRLTQVLRTISLRFGQKPRD